MSERERLGTFSESPYWPKGTKAAFNCLWNPERSVCQQEPPFFPCQPFLWVMHQVPQSSLLSLLPSLFLIPLTPELRLIWGWLTKVFCPREKLNSSEWGTQVTHLFTHSLPHSPGYEHLIKVSHLLKVHYSCTVSGLAKPAIRSTRVSKSMCMLIIPGPDGRPAALS